MSAATPAGSHPWTTPQIDELLGAVVSLRDREQARRFFRDLCTIGELEAMAQRWEVVRLLDEAVPYAEIARRTGASTATVTRVAYWLHHGEGGYQAMLKRTARHA